jgi:LacI family transcriptional regulator
VLQIDQRAVDTVPYVGVSQADAMRQIIGHLRDQGCQRFGYVGPGPRTPAAKERAEAFAEQTKPIDPRAAGRIHLGDATVFAGHEAAASLLACDPRPDAIVCGTDQAAVGVLQALREHGVSVPGDVAVTGFDDSVLAPACDPPLTSVRQPLEQLGTQAVQELTAAIEQHLPQPRSVMLEPELVIRSSSRR